MKNTRMVFGMRCRDARVLAALLALCAACEVGGRVGAAEVVLASGGDVTSTGPIELPPGRSTATVADVDELDDTGVAPDSDSSDTEPSAFDVGGPFDVDDTSGSDSSAGTTGTNCCEAMLGPGCAEPELEACVCDADPFCCEEQWDEACVDIAMFGGCIGGCIPPEPPPPDHCCVANEGPGCLDAEIEACVCAQDPYCCSYTWDDVCVGDVDEFGCGACAR
jgi:hypothetical protein